MRADDLDAARAHGLPILVCNDTWKLAPWADALIAMDTAWWRQNGARAAEQFGGIRFGFTQAAVKFGASQSAFGLQMATFGNTGAFAIACAVRSNAARVLLLGYDAAPGENGALHWHADHVLPLKNPGLSLIRWELQFARVAEHARKQGVEVVNCSRRTALSCFARQELEEALRTNAAFGFSTSEGCGRTKPALPLAPLAIAPSASGAVLT